MDVFFWSSQNWASLRVISMQFRVFFKVKVQNWDIFLVAKISNIFWGCVKFLIFFGVNGRCWVRAYVCGKKNRVPPPPWGALHVGYSVGILNNTSLFNNLPSFCLILNKTYSQNVISKTIFLEWNNGVEAFLKLDTL